MHHRRTVAVAVGGALLGVAAEWVAFDLGDARLWLPDLVERPDATHSVHAPIAHFGRDPPGAVPLTM